MVVAGGERSAGVVEAVEADCGGSVGVCCDFVGDVWPVERPLAMAADFVLSIGLDAGWALRSMGLETSSKLEVSSS